MLHKTAFINNQAHPTNLVKSFLDVYLPALKLLLALEQEQECRETEAHSPHTALDHCGCLSFSPSFFLPPAVHSRRSGDTWQHVKAFYSKPGLSVE